MTAFTKALQIFFIPEHLQIPFVGDDVIHHCGLGNPALALTFRTKGMLQEHPLPEPTPADRFIKSFRILGSFFPVVAPVVFFHVFGTKPVLR